MKPTRALRASLLLVVVGVFACANPVSDSVDECAGIDCSGHGGCVRESKKARCLCDPEFRAWGLECLPADPCQPNPCTAPNRTVCAAQGSVATCSCDPGFQDQGDCGRAVSCPPNPCTAPHQGVCALEGAQVVCRCDQGYRDDGSGSCEPIDPCDPNPCTELHRTACSAAGTTAVCRCDPGYWDMGTTCQPALSCTPKPAEPEPNGSAGRL